MHVGLNLIYLVPGETGGMETVARELIPELARLDGVRFTAFVNRDAALAEPDLWGALLPTEVVPVSVRNRAGWVLGEQWHLPRLAESARCDIVHSLASTAPLHGRFVRVTTIHDLNYRLVPESHFGIRGLGMRVLVPAAAHRSNRVIVDAASTRADLAKYLRTPPEKVDVVPLGVRVEPTARSARDALRRKLDLGERRMILSLSAKRPHKNVARLLRALERIPTERRPVLVVPGYPTPHEAELRALAGELGINRDVRMPAWLPGADLEALYADAACAVFPSLYEGFGLPVLEAMARGVPVACSNRASLPEVAGSAALLFDPEDVGAIQASIERLLTDDALARRLADAGRAHAEAFTWRRTAELTAASYRRALTAPAR